MCRNDMNVPTVNIKEARKWQASKWDFNFGGHQLQKYGGQTHISVAKMKKKWWPKIQDKRVKTNILSMI